MFIKINLMLAYRLKLLIVLVFYVQINVGIRLQNLDCGSVDVLGESAILAVPMRLERKSFARGYS